MTINDTSSLPDMARLRQRHGRATPPQALSPTPPTCWTVRACQRVKACAVAHSLPLTPANMPSPVKIGRPTELRRRALQPHARDLTAQLPYSNLCSRLSPPVTTPHRPSAPSPPASFPPTFPPAPALAGRFRPTPSLSAPRLLSRAALPAGASGVPARDHATHRCLATHGLHPLAPPAHRSDRCRRALASARRASTARDSPASARREGSREGPRAARRSDRRDSSALEGMTLRGLVGGNQG